MGVEDGMRDTPFGVLQIGTIIGFRDRRPRPDWATLPRSSALAPIPGPDPARDPGVLPCRWLGHRYH